MRSVLCLKTKGTECQKGGSGQRNVLGKEVCSSVTNVVKWEEWGWGWKGREAAEEECLKVRRKQDKE